MEWLNYHHLLYFWTIVQEGSVTAACRRLGLAQPTVSGQIRQLEKTLGHKLFEKSGRGLVLTGFGKMVAGYAEEIFTLGRELMAAVAQEPADRPVRLVVGVADVVPKLVAHLVLEPALSLRSPEVKLSVREGKTQHLLADLAIYELDLVLSDVPLGSNARVKAFNHLLGRCPAGLFAVPELARRYRQSFPESLQDAPLLLPTANTALRPLLDAWFEQRELRHRLVGEFEDSALLKVFGQKGHGLFPAPMVIASEVKRKYGVCLVGVLDEVVESFYAISLERRVRHPAVIAICESSRNQLFRDNR